MPLFRILLIGISTTLLSTGTLMARPATDVEIKQLEQTVDAYKKALSNQDTEALIKAYPPQVLEALALQVGVNEEQIKMLLSAQMKQFSQTSKIEDLSIDIKSKKQGELDNGTPYFTIPYSVVLKSEKQGKVKIKSEIVALNTNNNWYLVRADNAQFTAILQVSYPGFEKIQIAQPKTEKIN